MTQKELETAVRVYNKRQPFAPYLLEFVSGEKVRIDHREFVAPMIKNLWLFRGTGRAQSLFSSSSVCRVLDIVDANVS